VIWVTLNFVAVLRMTRAGVAWMAVGCARGAYENALAYARSREQFGKPIGGFQLVQDLLVRMLGNTTSSWGLCVRLSQLQDQGIAEDHHSSLAKRSARRACGRPSAGHES
jgi:glutaryl-CoA dehydrogenase